MGTRVPSFEADHTCLTSIFSAWMGTLTCRPHFLFAGGSPVLLDQEGDVEGGVTVVCLVAASGR